MYILYLYGIHFGDTAVLQSICRQIERRGRRPTRLINEVGTVPYSTYIVLFPAAFRVLPRAPHSDIGKGMRVGGDGKKKVTLFCRGVFFSGMT